MMTMNISEIISNIDSGITYLPKTIEIMKEAFNKKKVTFGEIFERFNIDFGKVACFMKGVPIESSKDTLEITKNGLELSIIALVDSGNYKIGQAKRIVKNIQPNDVFWLTRTVGG